VNKSIKESELRVMIKELFGGSENPSQTLLNMPPPNVPNYGNPEDDVVNVNAIVDHDTADDCDIVRAERRKDEEEYDDALFIDVGTHTFQERVELTIREEIRRLIK